MRIRSRPKLRKQTTDDELVRTLSSEEAELKDCQRRELQALNSAISCSDFTRARVHLDAADHSGRLLELTLGLKTVAEKTVPLAAGSRAKLSIGIGAMSLDSWKKRLFPPEAMLCLAGPASPDEIYYVDHARPLESDTSSTVHFQPTPESVYSALKRFDQFGYRLRAIIHSHPGEGPAASTPSPTDMQTLERLEHAYRAIGLIVTRDGYLRAFSKALEFQLNIYGKGIEVVDEKQRLYRLAAADIPSQG